MATATGLTSLTVAGVPILPVGGSQISTGDVYFVSSTAANRSDSSSQGTSKDLPFATLAYAIGRSTANNGDIIYVMPGHTETITAANGVDVTVAGVKIIGLGWGLSRPVMNFTTAVGASFRVNANSVWVENIRFTGGIDNLTNVIVVNAVTDVVLKDLEYRDVTGQCAIGLSCANNTDRLTIDGYRHIGDSAAGTTRAMQFNGCDDLVVRNFYLYGNFSTSAVDFVTTLSNRVWFYNGYVWTENSADLCFNDTITGSTGTFGPELYMVLQDNAANITEAITGATFQVMDDHVQVVNAVNEKSMAINWVASTDA